MNRIVLLALLGFLSACTSKQTTVISYSGAFELTLPTSIFSDATIFSADELSLKTSDKKLISGLIINPELESLPKDFVLADYPQYILNLKPIKTLSNDLAEKFTNSAEEVNAIYGLDNVVIKKTDDVTTYSLCKENRCLAYVIKSEIKDHLLSLHTQNVSQEEFNKLLEGF